MMRQFYFKLSRIRFRDTGSDGSGTQGGGGGDGAGLSISKAPVFTPEQQAHIGVLLSKEREKLKEKNSETVKQLEALQATIGMTEKDKAALQEQIERLKTEHMTNEELRRAEVKRTIDTITAEKQKAETDAKQWRTQFEQHLVQAELIGAANDNKAYRAQQIVSMFGKDCKVVPKLDEAGKEIPGAFVVRMTANIDGKVLETSPTEIVKALRESKDYANLFDYEGTGGTGTNRSQNGGSQLDLARAATDQNYYKQNRAAILAADRKG